MPIDAAGATIVVQGVWTKIAPQFAWYFLLDGIMKKALTVVTIAAMQILKIKDFENSW